MTKLKVIVVLSMSAKPPLAPRVDKSEEKSDGKEKVTEKVTEKGKKLSDEKSDLAVNTVRQPNNWTR